jgi:hypothetical protein
MNEKACQSGPLERTVSPRDRELLALAAKAAGYTFCRMCDNEADGALLFGVPGPWNPLDDDGDALRLIVRLRLDVLFGPVDVEVTASQMPDGDGVCPWSWFATEPGDANKATRRAIVQAAAEVGKRANAGGEPPAP